MREEHFYDTGIYHVFNRGVDKRKIFLDDSDRIRFLERLHLFNNENYRSNQSQENSYANTDLPINPYVRIMCYSLMPNHFHLQLEQIIENGVSDFMSRIANGYTKYFNKKYDRKGRLFETCFKASEIKNDDYLLNLTRYIHLNPLDLIEPGWKKNKIPNWSRVSQFLENYPWSSYPSYLKIKKDPVIDLGIIKDLVNKPNAYIKFMQEWTGKNFDRIHPLFV